MREERADPYHKAAVVQNLILLMSFSIGQHDKYMPAEEEVRLEQDIPVRHLRHLILFLPDAEV